MPCVNRSCPRTRGKSESHFGRPCPPERRGTSNDRRRARAVCGTDAGEAGGRCAWRVWTCSSALINPPNIVSTWSSSTPGSYSTMTPVSNARSNRSDSNCVSVPSGLISLISIGRVVPCMKMVQGVRHGSCTRLSSFAFSSPRDLDSAQRGGSDLHGELHGFERHQALGRRHGGFTV